jgi:hypothetical protein
MLNGTCTNCFTSAADPEKPIQFAALKKQFLCFHHFTQLLTFIQTGKNVKNGDSCNQQYNYFGIS